MKSPIINNLTVFEKFPIQEFSRSHFLATSIGTRMKIVLIICATIDSPCRFISELVAAFIVAGAKKLGYAQVCTKALPSRLTLYVTNGIV